MLDDQRPRLTSTFRFLNEILCDTQVSLGALWLPARRSLPTRTGPAGNALAAAEPEADAERVPPGVSREPVVPGGSPQVALVPDGSTVAAPGRRRNLLRRWDAWWSSSVQASSSTSAAIRAWTCSVASATSSRSCTRPGGSRSS